MSAHVVHVLAGDIGGTKTLLQIAEFEGAAMRVLAEQRFDSRAYPGLAPMAYEFLATQGRLGIERACFGVAGPVSGDAARQQASLTNLPWRMDSDELAQSLGLARVRLINDFQALGYGIEGLDSDSLEPLQEVPGEAGGPRLVIGAGTGLGVAFLHRIHDHYEVFPTEAGHMDFAPTDEDQDDLLAWLRRQHERVSYERVVSGMGIEDTFRFFLEREGRNDHPLLNAPDIPAAVSAAAIDGHDSIAVRTLALFVEAYGSVAGNLALAALARGGVYVGGGIAPKILPLLRDRRFIAAFNRKGRMSPLTRAMPVYVITDPKVGLVGATLAARRL
ncbi:MAG: glucokinase [Thiohalomonadaceae bacterium]